MHKSVKCEWLLCCVLFVLGQSLIDCRVVRFVIDEELEPGSKIGSLLDHVPGAFNNLNFVRLSNSEDASNWFTVDQYSGDVNVASRLDREQLCTVKSPGSDDSLIKTPTDHYPIAEYLSPCELRFSVNCLSAHSASSVGPVGGKVIELFDVVVTLRDINDNGCVFLPQNKQTIRLREDTPVGTTRVLLYTPFDPDDARNGHSLNLASIRFTNADNKFVQAHQAKSLKEVEFHQIFRLHSRFILPKKYPGDETEKLTESNRAQVELELIRALDYEQEANYSFGVTANDGSGRKDHVCTLQVLLLVEDCNDNAPRFQQTHYVANLSENTPIGTMIIQLNATDADSGTHGEITYSLVGSSTEETSPLFYVHPTKGELRLQHRLNHRQKAQHKLTIQATNEADQTDTSNRITIQSEQLATVEVNVLDVNDQAPKIRLFSPTGSEQLEVMEESPPGQDVAILDVTDRDVGQNAEVECHLINQSVSSTLKMQFLSGPAELVEKDYTKKRYKLTVIKSLDRERVAEVRFTVRCWDHGSPRQTTVLSSVLTVVDINDHAPQFEKEIYSVSVVEDSDPERSKFAFKIIQVHASDKDAGLNAQIRYRLDHGTTSELLNLIKVEPTTGVVSSTGTLDRETMESFSMTILASDMGEPSRSARCKVNVRILDYNDNAPSFSKAFFTLTLLENSPIGQLIGTLQVTDADLEQNSQITVRLEDGPDRVELLNSPPWATNGLSSERNVLESGVKQLYGEPPLISRKAERQMGLPQLRVVSYQPHQRPTGYRVKNGSLYEVQLYTNSIWDREALFLTQFRKPVLDTSANLGFGHIQAARLALSSNKNWTNETQTDPYVIVHLRAEDGGNPALIKRVPVRIRVLDENDNNPTFLFPDSNAVNITRVAVSRNEPQNFVFAQVYAFDEDNGPNGTVKYFIQSGDPNGYFNLDELSGALTLNKRLPTYALGEHTLHLEARDGGQPPKSTIARLVIEVDESVPKGLMGQDLYTSHSNSLFDSGAAGHTFNLYILIAIVVASAVVSALLLFSIFFLLRRSRRARSCRHVSGCANGTRLNKSNSTDPITDKYNSVHWPLTGGMTSPTSHYDERGQLYTDLNYRAYSPLLDGPNSIDLTEHGSTFLQDPNGLTINKRHATLINPHLYSVGGLINCDTLKPSNVELYIPSAEQVASPTNGHYMSGEQVAFYSSITAQEPMTPSHTTGHHPNQTFTLSGNKYGFTTNTQSGQTGLESGVLCFSGEKGIPCQVPHQQLCYLAPVNSRWSQTAPTSATPVGPTVAAVNLESNSVRSVDCDSGNGDSLDIIPSTAITLMTRIPNSLGDKQTYLNC